MDEVFINNLSVRGVHGATAKEKNVPQRFLVSVRMRMRSGACRTDRLEDALDYRIAKKIIEEVFSGAPVSLIETLAERIARRILEETTARRVTVAIEKPDIWKNGSPGITITREKTPRHLELLDFDMEHVVDELSAVGCVSLPILPEGRRRELLAEARTFSYAPQPEVIGGGKVREQLSSFADFPKDSGFHRLHDDVMELMLRKLSALPLQNIFATPFCFNDMSLQKYEAGSIGITPHKDGKSRINIICVFVLTGASEFGLCSDRAGTNPVLFDSTPGNVIMLRGPGFLHGTRQPFHFVRSITEERIVFGLRQKTYSSPNSI